MWQEVILENVAVTVKPPSAEVTAAASLFICIYDKLINLDNEIFSHSSFRNCSNSINLAEERLLLA